MNYTREELFKHSGELLELIEDVVAYYCAVSYTHLTLLTILRV